eukprot:NODE_90_length_3745_cov_5.849917.p1 GENE.NODE_90_length_3745_cov_5.849917~~NODE_90_length_3745_cov_5.849917.p1  ORF type:complete len:712 (-),score=142.63 NODE_90_length_3745_cov_5.849917:536-2671(-)
MARNPAGETSTTLTFAVQVAPPKGLAYFFDGASREENTVGDEFTLPSTIPEEEMPSSCRHVCPLRREMQVNPTVVGKVDEYNIDPELPEGVSIDDRSGIISGRPAVETHMVCYKVTARNVNGETWCNIVFAVREMPPSDLCYPSIDDEYTHGEEVSLEPEIVGGADQWVVEPLLPAGLMLDGATGRIDGAPTETAVEMNYTVTASNKAGGTSTVLTFSVIAPPPEGLAYSCHEEYTRGADVELEPMIDSCVCAAYTIVPELPAGLTIDRKTGVISGSATEESKATTYTVTATNIAGSCSVELTFAIAEKIIPVAVRVNEAVAEKIINCATLEELPDEPPKNMSRSDWMIWMVHRAYLNDPTLTEFNFNGMSMPLAYHEPRIAPKLMKALASNTHIVGLHLACSNMQKPQGPDLADALRVNSTLRVLNIESNNLDSECLRGMIMAVHENQDSDLREWRFTNQKHIGQFFGLPVEQEMFSLMRDNTNIVRLGFTCQDAHWRNEIDRCILRNVDSARRRRKGSCYKPADETPSTEKPLGGLMLSNVPEESSWELFDDADARVTVLRNFIADQCKMPTNQQLQIASKAAGLSLKFSEFAPLIKDFRSKLLSTSLNHVIECADAYGSRYPGTLRAWTEKNDKWNIDFWPSNTERAERWNFTSNRAISFEITRLLASWIRIQNFELIPHTPRGARVLMLEAEDESPAAPRPEATTPR